MKNRIERKTKEGGKERNPLRFGKEGTGVLQRWGGIQKLGFAGRSHFDTHVRGWNKTRKKYIRLNREEEVSDERNMEGGIGRSPNSLWGGSIADGNTALEELK